MINLYTIGFTKKSAEIFFEILIENGIKKILDIRYNNVSQLAAFSKGKDLEYFAKIIANIEYEHWTDAAPTKKLLSNYRAGETTWEEYQEIYIKTLESRDILNKIDINDLDGCCLLSSEHIPDNCHRRLLAEYLRNVNDDIEIIHLK